MWNVGINFTCNFMGRSDAYGGSGVRSSRGNGGRDNCLLHLCSDLTVTASKPFSTETSVIPIFFCETYTGCSIFTHVFVHITVFELCEYKTWSEQSKKACLHLLSLIQAQIGVLSHLLFLIQTHNGDFCASRYRTILICKIIFN